MPSFLDFMERATTGPIISENEFNMGVLIPNVRKMVREYDIEYDPANPVPSDDEFADRLFEGAIEFLAKTGVYCDATSRIIRLDRAEIMEAVENLPEGRTFGQRKDHHLFKC
ncbi:MAG: monomethylamine:corrinoid methyltransferase [Thermodesulfobacteriota bacterium]